MKQWTLPSPGLLLSSFAHAAEPARAAAAATLSEIVAKTLESENRFK